MVNIIENCAYVQGVVRSLREHQYLKGYKQIELALTSTNNVDGFPNLARADEGNVVFINIRPDQLPASPMKCGEHFSCRVKKAYGQVYFMN